MKDILIKAFSLFAILIACNISACARTNSETGDKTSSQSKLAGQLRSLGWLQSESPAVKATTAHEIAQTGSYAGDDIALLIKCLSDHTQVKLIVSATGSSITFDNSATTPSEQARNALVRIGKPTVDKLLATVKSESPSFGGGYYGVGWGAVESLGLIGDKRALPVLLQLLKEGKIGYRNSVGGENEIPVAVARIGKNDVTDELLLAYDKAKASNRLNDGVIYALGYSQDERCLPILIGNIEGSDRSAKLASIHALGYLKSKKGVPILLKTLEDVDLHARWYSCEAFAEIGDKEAIPPLRHLLETEKRSPVKDAAKEALKKLDR
jgi:HEAT repeat protein